MPDDVDARLAEIETALQGYDERPAAFEPDEVAHAGAFVSIDGEGRLRIERGYVRPENELFVAPEPDADKDGEVGSNPDGEPSSTAQAFRSGEAMVHDAALSDADEEGGLKPLASYSATTEASASSLVSSPRAVVGQPELEQIGRQIMVSGRITASDGASADLVAQLKPELRRVTPIGPSG